jgi:Recombinase zinc beta ribbon domain
VPQSESGEEWVLSFPLGKKLVGTAAHGRNYRYYTCNGRHQYGRFACQAGRLAADKAEDQVLRKLVRIYSDSAILHDAADRIAVSHAEQAAVVASEITRVEGAIRRYRTAFEAGTMPAEECGPRLQELGGQLRELRERTAELARSASDVEPIRVDELHVADIRDQLEEAVRRGTSEQKKALLRALGRRVSAAIGFDRLAGTFRHSR